MASKEKQVKNAYIYMLPAVVGNILPLLILPILTRILTKEDYGIWALAQVYAIFVNGVANFGLSIGYERNFFEYKETNKDAGLLYTTLLFVIVSFIVGGIITYLFKYQLSRWIIGSPEHASILFWSYCAVSVVGLKTYYLTYFKNTENAKAFAWYTIDENLLGMLLSLFMVAYLHIGIIGLVWGQLIASCIVFTILSIKFTRVLPLRFDIKALIESLKLSWPLTPRIFLGIIGSQFDKYLIGMINTVGGVGVYNIGQKVANVVLTFMNAIQNVFAPQVYKRMFEMPKEGGESIGKYLTPFLYSSILIAVLISLFSEEIINLLTPKSYHGAIDIVIILTMLNGSYFFGKQPQLIYVKKTHISSLLTMIGIVLNVAINVLFISTWGAIGAAWGTLLAGLITGAITFILSQYYYRIHWEYGKVISILLTFYLTALITILLRNTELTYPVRLAVKSFSLGIYIYLGVKIGIVTKENYYLLKRTFPVVRC